MRRFAGCILHAGKIAEVDVDFVNAAIFNDGRDFGHRGFEQARIPAVFIEISR